MCGTARPLSAENQSVVRVLLEQQKRQSLQRQQAQTLQLDGKEPQAGKSKAQLDKSLSFGWSETTALVKQLLLLEPGLPGKRSEIAQTNAYGMKKQHSQESGLLRVLQNQDTGGSCSNLSRL